MPMRPPSASMRRIGYGFEVPTVLSRHFKIAAVESLAPSYVAVFDLADTKRRNMHLGRLRVDEDIATFHSILTGAFPAGESLAARIEGNVWVAVLKGDHRPRLAGVIGDYGQRLPARWERTCRATSLGGEERVAEFVFDVVIERAVRCGVHRLRKAVDFARVVRRIRKQVGLLPVNRVVRIGKSPPVRPVRRWECVTGDNYWSAPCPFCATAFWLDWQGLNCFDDTCSGCGATLDV